MRIGIIWGTPYATNLGVSALAYSILAIINDVLQKDNRKVSILFIGTGKWDKDVINVGNYKIEFENIGSLNIIKNLRSSVKHRILSKLLDIDIVLDMGAGDSFSDIYGKERFHRLLLSKKIFRFLGKKQILLPQTIGPFSDKKHEKSAFNIMKKLDMIMCRDKQSYNYCTNFLSNDILTESIDLAFFLPFKPLKFDTNRVNIGINLSGLLWNGGYTRDNQFNLKLDYQKLMRRIIDYFYCKENFQVHLIGHVIHLNNKGIEDDFTVCELLTKEYPGICIAPKFTNPIDAKNYISGMDFFTGARMHSCIAAFSSGIPSYPLSYSRKFNGLFEDTLNYHWIGDCTNENLEDVLNGVKDAFRNKNILTEEIKRANNLIVKERIKTFKENLKIFLE